MSICPYCGSPDVEAVRRWRFKWWDVTQHQCRRCGGRFNSYVDPEGRRKTFVIKIWPRAGNRR